MLNLIHGKAALRPPPPPRPPWLDVLRMMRCVCGLGHLIHVPAMIFACHQSNSQSPPCSGRHRGTPEQHPNMVAGVPLPDTCDGMLQHVLAMFKRSLSNLSSPCQSASSSCCSVATTTQHLGFKRLGWCARCVRNSDLMSELWRLNVLTAPHAPSLHLPQQPERLKATNLMRFCLAHSIVACVRPRK